MSAVTIACPVCRAGLTLKGRPPAGMTEAKCPKCGAAVPLVAPPEQERTSVQADRANQETTAPAGLSRGGEFSFLAPSQAADEIGRIGPYRVLGELGRGGMGAVFRAEDPALRRKVALKVMLPQFAADPAAKARFLREARAQAAVEHDHVAPIHQVGEDRGVPFLAMPLLKGQPLSDALRENPRVPVAEAVRVAREIASGLAAAHETGMVHRDVKPANVWLEGPERRVKLLDFGLARAAAGGEGDGEEAVTQTGAVVGTPAYMSPEQARGEKLDGRSDLFSLGCVLYQMLAGQPPFRAPNVTGVLIAVATENPPPLSSLNPAVPPELEALATRLLAKRAGDRPATAEEVAARLRSIEVGLGVTAVIPPPVGGSPAALIADRAPDPWAGIDATEDDVAPAPAPRPAAGQRRPGRRLPLAVAVGVTLLVGVGLLVRQFAARDPAEKGKAREAEVKPVEKVEVAQKPAKDRPKEPPAPPAVAPDRAVAEFFRSIGAGLFVNDDPVQINPPGELPKGPLRLTGVNLYTNPKVTDADLARLRDCASLSFLSLHGTRVTEAGLAHLKGITSLRILSLAFTSANDASLANFEGCKNLTDLDLCTTKITDAGLAHFKDCKSLRKLDLGYNQLTDAGLAHFQDCKELRSLVLHHLRVSAAGLAHFRGCKNLEELNLFNTPVTEEGLAHFKDCKSLKFLDLPGSGVTDAGLAHFRDCSDLNRLDLARTPVTDAGLAHLKDCALLRVVLLSETRVSDAGLAQLQALPVLSELDVRSTKVTAVGVAELQKALPNCRVRWDEPKP